MNECRAGDGGTEGEEHVEGSTFPAAMSRE